MAEDLPSMGGTATSILTVCYALMRCAVLAFVSMKNDRQARRWVFCGVYKNGTRPCGQCEATRVGFHQGAVQYYHTGSMPRRWVSFYLFCFMLFLPKREEHIYVCWHSKYITGTAEWLCAPWWLYKLTFGDTHNTSRVYREWLCAMIIEAYTINTLYRQGRSIASSS
jgi:hypothetical protein